MSASTTNLILITIGAIVFFSIVFGILLYVFKAIGMYAISRRRKLGASGLAWVPILRVFKFGQIADDAVENKRGQRTHYVALYPIFMIAGSVLMGISSTLAALAVRLSPAMIRQIVGGNYEVIERIAERAIHEPTFLVGMIIGVVGYILCVISSVFYMICLFHIYKSCSRKYIAMFILSFFFSFLPAIFLFAIRKQDNPRWYRYDRNEPVEPPAMGEEIY